MSRLPVIDHKTMEGVLVRMGFQTYARRAAMSYSVIPMAEPQPRRFTQAAISAGR